MPDEGCVAAVRKVPPGARAVRKTVTLYLRKAMARGALMLQRDRLATLIVARLRAALPG